MTYNKPKKNPFEGGDVLLRGKVVRVGRPLVSAGFIIIILILLFVGRYFGLMFQ